MISLSGILGADCAERGEARLKSRREMPPHALLCGVGVARFDRGVDVEMFADRLTRAIDVVLPHLLEREAALGAQIVVGLRQTAVAGGAEHLVVEGPADMLRVLDIERRALLNPA